MSTGRWIAESTPLRWLCRYARPGIRHPGKLRMIRLLDRLVGNHVMRFEGGAGRMRIDLADYLGWSLVTKGAFEPLSLRAAISIMRGDGSGIFLDVGAHFGLFTIAVASSTGCEVVAVEGSDENFRVLEENLLLNPALRVQAVSCCATARPRLVQLSREDDGRSAWTRVVENGVPGRAPFRAGLPLEAVLTEIGVGRIRLLKIDVEGYELEVFRGLDWSGDHRPEFIVMECNPEEGGKLNFLRDLGYSVTSVEGRSVTGEEATYPEGNLVFADKSRPRESERS